MSLEIRGIEQKYCIRIENRWKREGFDRKVTNLHLEVQTHEEREVYFDLIRPSHFLKLDSEFRLGTLPLATFVCK